MIQINKEDCPPNLKATHLRKNKEMGDAYDKDSKDYKNGTNEFDFGSSYNTTEVRDLLIAKQYNKCCFSEAKFVGDYSDVEHFRPKGRVDNYDTKEKMYPGYYWLAYEWDNLFLSKTRPNKSQKRNFFPLYNENERNRSHHDSYDENPQLIDPGKENPRDYINFHMDVPIGIDENGRGKFNIDFFELRHSEFTEARRKKLRLLESLKGLVDLALKEGIPKENQLITNALQELRTATSPEEEFSSMAIDFLKDWLPLK